MERVETHTPYLAVLEKMDPDVVLVAAKQVEQLVALPGWEFLLQLVTDVRGLKEKHLMAGFFNDSHPDMAREVGLIAGLCALDDAPGALALKAERINEERAKTEPEEVR